MKYQETPQQDFETDFGHFIENSKQTIEAADAVSVFAKQKLGEKGNNSTEEETASFNQESEELLKKKEAIEAIRANKESEELLNKFASAVDAEKKALQNLIKTYGKTKVHEQLRKFDKELENFINKQPKGELESTQNSMRRALQTKTERHIQETAPFSLTKFIKGLVNAVMKIFKKSTPKESSDSQMSNSDRDKERPEQQMSNSDRDKAVSIQRAIVDYADIEKKFGENYKQLSHDELKKYAKEINQRSQKVATAANEVGEEFLDKYPAYKRKIQKAKINTATLEANTWLDIYKELEKNPKSSDYQERLTEAQNKILEISQKNPQFRSEELNKALSTTVRAILSEQTPRKAPSPNSEKRQESFQNRLEVFNNNQKALENNTDKTKRPVLQAALDISREHVTQFGNKHYKYLTPDQQRQHGEIKDIYIKDKLNKVSDLHEIIDEKPHVDARATLTISKQLLKDVTALNSTTEEHIDHIKQAGTKQAELEKKYGSPQQKSSNP